MACVFSISCFIFRCVFYSARVTAAMADGERKKNRLGRLIGEGQIALLPVVSKHLQKLIFRILHMHSALKRVQNFYDLFWSRKNCSPVKQSTEESVACQVSRLKGLPRTHAWVPSQQQKRTPRRLINSVGNM